MASRETENSTYANFGVTNLTKSIMVCYDIFWSGQLRWLDPVFLSRHLSSLNLSYFNKLVSVLKVL